MARLVLQTPEGQQTVELRDHNTLGRHPSSSVQLLDKIVSKEHCIIERRGRAFWLRDLGSLNGTYINKERVQGEKELKHADEIALGQTRARFEEPVSAAPPPAMGTESEPFIGAELTETATGDFRSFEEIKHNKAQLRADYERLRLSYLLTRDIADEKDPAALYQKILKSIFKFIPAQRGVIFINHDSQLRPVAEHRTDAAAGAISVSTTILSTVVGTRRAVLTHDAAGDFAESKNKSMILNQIQSAIVAPMLHRDELLGVLWLDSKSLAQFKPKDLELVSAVANQAAMFIEINLLSQQKTRLSRLVSPNVFDRIVRERVDIQPGGTRTDVTVSMCDIRGFIRLSEHTPPEEIVVMLNGYFELMVDVLFRFEGSLDKFMTDRIMALFGVPVSHGDDPERAVLCALDQLEVLARFNQERMQAGKAGLGVGFGINSGPVVSGFIGSKKALSFTVIGDVANTSARLCAQALPGQIVISESTRAQLGPQIEVEELAPMRVAGKEKALRVFNVVRQRGQSARPSRPRGQSF